MYIKYTNKSQKQNKLNEEESTFDWNNLNREIDCTTILIKPNLTSKGIYNLTRTLSLRSLQHKMINHE